MGLTSICPNCNMANDPASVQCSACRTAIGAVLVGEARDSFRWFAVSAFISLCMYLVCLGLGLHVVTVLVPLFYGPLLASYFARSNVVWASALGAMLMLLFISFVSLIDPGRSTARVIATRLIRGDSETLMRGVELVLATVVAGVVVFPVPLIGSLVGELLSVRRSRGPAFIENTEA